MIQMIDISCNCGADLARNVVIVETSDVRRITAALSEHCPVCRDRRSHPEPQALACANSQSPMVARTGGLTRERIIPKSEVPLVSS